VRHAACNLDERSDIRGWLVPRVAALTRATAFSDLAPRFAGEIKKTGPHFFADAPVATLQQFFCSFTGALFRTPHTL
jgi:hypothetical protein